MKKSRSKKDVLDVDIPPEAFFSKHAGDGLPELPHNGAAHDIFDKLNNMCVNAEKSMEEAWNNIVRALNNPDNIDMQGRFAHSNETRALSKGEMLAKLYDIPELTQYCDQIKRKAISIGGKSRDENVKVACAVANNQAELQKAGMLNKMRGGEVA